MDHGMDHIVEISRRTVFTLDEAQQLLPVVFRITKSYSQKVEAMIERLEALGGSDETLVDSLESQVNHLIQEWQNKIQKLGALPKGLWIADFDSGDGYFCWKFPERGIEYWHQYSDGFSKRMHVREKCRPISLQDRLFKKANPVIPFVLPSSDLRD